MATDQRTEVCLNACESLSTHALRYGIVPQLIEACQEALALLEEGGTERRAELLKSRLRLVLTKATDKEPHE